MDKMQEAAMAAARDRERRELVRALEKAVNTTMIGALALFEEAFGYLWEVDREAAEDWSRCRTEVLNLGNARRRALLAELEKYEVQRTKWRS